MGVFGWVRDAAGAFTTVDVPGSFETDIYGINASGSTVGQFNTVTGAGQFPHGFVRDPSGTITTFDATVVAEYPSFRHQQRRSNCWEGGHSWFPS